MREQRVRREPVPNLPAGAAAFEHVACDLLLVRGEPEFPHDSIGVRRFELRTSPTRTERATRLRHTPSAERVAIIGPWLSATRSSASPTEPLQVGTASPSTGRPACSRLGADEVTKIACGVSSSKELFERAAAAGAKPPISRSTTGCSGGNEPGLDRTGASAGGWRRSSPPTSAWPRLSPCARCASRKPATTPCSRRSLGSRSSVRSGDGQGGETAGAARDRGAHRTRSRDGRPLSSRTARIGSSASRSARGRPGAS